MEHFFEETLEPALDLTLDPPPPDNLDAGGRPLRGRGVPPGGVTDEAAQG